ncbi:MAG: hypothetical protein M3M85_01535 [bacterium]|nr:hypothetical protein [bacterium]
MKRRIILVLTAAAAIILVVVYVAYVTMHHVKEEADRVILTTVDALLAGEGVSSADYNEFHSIGCWQTGQFAAGYQRRVFYGLVDKRGIPRKTVEQLCTEVRVVPMK